MPRDKIYSFYLFWLCATCFLWSFSHCYTFDSIVIFGCVGVTLCSKILCVVGRQLSLVSANIFWMLYFIHTKIIANWFQPENLASLHPHSLFSRDILLTSCTSPSFYRLPRQSFTKFWYTFSAISFSANKTIFFWRRSPTWTTCAFVKILWVSHFFFSVALYSHSKSFAFTCRLMCAP